MLTIHTVRVPSFVPTYLPGAALDWHFCYSLFPHTWQLIKGGKFQNYASDGGIICRFIGIDTVELLRFRYPLSGYLSGFWMMKLIYASESKLRHRHEPHTLNHISLNRLTVQLRIHGIIIGGKKQHPNTAKQAQTMILPLPCATYKVCFLMLIYATV